MKVTTERLENCIVALDIQLEEKESTNYLRSTARAISQNHRIRGFRPGKAPYSVVVRSFGIDAVHNQVIKQFGEKILQAGLEKSGLEPIDQASLKDVTWEPSLTLHLEVPVGPEVDLGAYRDIRIPWKDVEIMDEDIDKALLRLQEEKAEWVSSEQPAELGDQIVIDITSTVEEKVVLQNTAREMVLNANSPYPLPGFAEQVVGMTPDESREFDLSYPKDHYNPDTAGKVGHLKVHLRKIRAKPLPPLDDEFAALVGDYKDLQDLKTNLRQLLLKEAERENHKAYMEKVWEKLFEMVTVEYPDVYVDREIEAIRREIEDSLKRQGMDMATYFQLTNTTEDAWKDQVRSQAVEQLRRKLILTQIVSDEHIQLEEGEIDAEVDRIAEPMGDNAEDMRESLRAPQGMLMISSSLLTTKTIERLKEIARGQAPDLEKAEKEPSEGDVSQPVEAEAEALAEPLPEPIPETVPETEADQETALEETASLETLEAKTETDKAAAPEGNVSQSVEAEKETQAETQAESLPKTETEQEMVPEAKTAPEAAETSKVKVEPDKAAATKAGEESSTKASA